MSINEMQQSARNISEKTDISIKAYMVNVDGVHLKKDDGIRNVKEKNSLK